MHACTYSHSRDVKLLNILAGSSEMLLSQRDLCSGWRWLCETTDQLIIIFCRSRRLPTDNLTRPCHCSIYQALYSIMHAFFSYWRGITLLKILSRNVQIWSEIKLFVDQDSQFLPLTFFTISIMECNHHTQYLFAMVCVLLYIFLKGCLIFLGFAVARWKWICKPRFLFVKSRFHSRPPPFLFWV